MEGAATNSGLAEQLTKLATLHADGALTDEEFHAFKASLLASATNSQISPPGTPGSENPPVLFLGRGRSTPRLRPFDGERRMLQPAW